MDLSEFYRDRRVFLTGHTGFKGSWLCAYLNRLGAKICGFSETVPTSPAHFPLIENDCKLHDHRGDVRDISALKRSLQDFAPEIVFHLAAQPLVRRSYEQPADTFSTNVMGTVHLLEAARAVPSIRAIVVITSDKCYENKEWVWGYRETDPLGGFDPYSASKACTEIVVASFRQSYPSERLIASVRAGNVIGGGDWAEDRLIPDIVQTASIGKTIFLRMPRARRPWNHVLDPLRGYLLLARRLLQGEREFAQAWNFGPGPEGNLSVGELVELAARFWDRIHYVMDSGDRESFHEGASNGSGLSGSNGSSYETGPAAKKHEATLLMLDCSKARTRLGWEPLWSLEEGVKHTIRWYRQFYENDRILTWEQIDEYLDRS